MPDATKSEDKPKRLQPAVPEAVLNSLKSPQQLTGQEIYREVLQRELAHALVVARATLESTSDAILVTDEKAKVIDFNQKYLDMWKIPHEVLSGGNIREVRELMSQNFAEPLRFLARVEEIVATSQESFDVLQLKDGRILERYSKVLTLEGKSAGRVWSYRDVTDRRLAEITSRQLAAIVASSDDAIIGKDLNGIITSWNIGAQRIFGYSADEMIGTPIMRLIPPDRHEEEQEILSRIRRGEHVDHFETIRLAKDGRQLNIWVTISPIKDSTGHVVGASKVARDVTAWKKAREETEIARLEAERANRVKDEFLAMLSHELRTPLNAVLGWTNILRLKMASGEELKQGLDVIERNARAQSQLVEDLLDMSRIISGKIHLEPQEVDLCSVLNDSIETLRTAADGKGVRLNNAVRPFAVLISGDPNRLRQVFWNLLHNAIKFTPKDGKVEVRLEHAQSHVTVSLIDSGEGIAPELLPYVFDRFQQADTSTTRRHGGLGLGLSIVKHLVELHGGHVRVTSSGVGKGTTFTVELPLLGVDVEREKERGNAEPLLPQSQIAQNISLSHVHVLVVDDDVDSRELVKKLLEMAGARVSLADSAAEAMQRIRASRPDVIICDIGMQGEDGFSFVQRLRALEKSQERALPALALSGYARSEDRTKAIFSGFQSYLAKPVEPLELLATVRSLAGKPKLRSLDES
jgi:PAS domain S-box-containing protein